MLRNRLNLITKMALIVLGILWPSMAPAQTFRILHDFTNHEDGGTPRAGVTLDNAGNLYGTVTFDAYFTGGRVYQLKPVNGSWVYNLLHTFYGGANDGKGPAGKVTFGPNGTLYLLTEGGGDNSSCPRGCGTVYNLRPQRTVCKTSQCLWEGEVVYRFQGGNDGANPVNTQPVFDPAGNMYGTTLAGGPTDYGTVFELTRSGSGWTESVLYDFTASGGNQPNGIALDTAGNIYGITNFGGDPSCRNRFGCGTVYQLAHTGGGWVETTLHAFHDQSDGFYPSGTPFVDQAGNVYATADGGSGGGGTVVEASPSDGSWIFSVLYGITRITGYQIGAGPTMDGAGNLYGTTFDGGAYGDGSVFKLSPANGSWIYTDLHDFHGADGYWPVSDVAIDRNGNLYGTTSSGGAHGYGVVWEITP